MSLNKMIMDSQLENSSSLKTAFNVSEVTMKKVEKESRAEQIAFIPSFELHEDQISGPVVDIDDLPEEIEILLNEDSTVVKTSHASEELQNGLYHSNILKGNILSFYRQSSNFKEGEVLAKHVLPDEDGVEHFLSLFVVNKKTLGVSYTVIEDIGAFKVPNQKFLFVITLDEVDADVNVEEAFTNHVYEEWVDFISTSFIELKDEIEYHIKENNRKADPSDTGRFDPQPNPEYGFSKAILGYLNSKSVLFIGDSIGDGSLPEGYHDLHVPALLIKEMKDVINGFDLTPTRINNIVKDVKFVVNALKPDYVALDVVPHLQHSLSQTILNSTDSGLMLLAEIDGEKKFYPV